MDKAKTPKNEAQRLSDLKNLCILGTLPEERFDRVTRMAKQLFSVESCLVSFIDEKKQWVKSSQGFNDKEISRDDSFCAHTILSEQALIVEDSLLDSRFSDNPLVSGSPKIRFYAGTPITGPDKYRIGTFSIFASEPRKLSDEEKKNLFDISQIIQNEVYSSSDESLVQKFEEGESRLQAIINNVVDGIITITETGIIETINPAAVNLFGYTEKEVIGKNVKMLMPEPYRNSHDGYLKNYRNTGVAKIIGIGREVIGKRKDGRTFPMELAVSEMMLNGNRGFTGIVRDISLRKMEEELRAKYANIIQTSSDAIVSYDPKGRITSWNLAAEKMFGYPESHIIEQSYSQLVPDSLVPEYEAMYERLESGEAVEFFETQRITKNGNIIDVSVSISPIVDENGALKEVSSISRDISEQKKWTEELVRAKEEAEQASQSKTEFVANMSHEIRTPLNAILGMSRIIGKTKLSLEQNNYLNMIQSSGKSLLGIINDILDFSKVESGKMELSISDFILSDMIRSVANVMSVNTGEKALELIIDINNDTPKSFKGDIQRIQQILINLVSNSIKFTESGEIKVAINSQKLTAQTHQLKLTVEDSGMGMSDEQQERLFSAFSQADSSITRRYGGSGLGLVIAKRFVELMGGNIEIESSLGKGTKIMVEFPIAISELKDRPAKREPALNDLRLLVIDDNKASSEAISHAIASIGWQAETLGSGKDLHTWLTEQFKSGISYDFLLIDNTLPGENSLNIINEIESNFTEYELPTALMANAFRQDQAQLTQLSENQRSTLIKPVTSSSLFDCVCEKLHQKNGVVNEPHIDADSEQLKGIHILVVEDNGMNQMVAQCMLKEYGATFDFANNGEEAVDILRSKSNEYDIVLMDVQMPVMDGFTATKIIRNELHLDIPVLALSAGVLNSERESCTKAGMNDFVAKPIDADTLYATIDRHLPYVTARTQQ